MNINKLRGKIVENGMNMNTLAEELGIDRSTIYRKINSDGTTFTIKEVNQICGILKLSKEEAVSIFFTNYVA